MEKLLHCPDCSTAIVIELGMSDIYYGPDVKCARCNIVLVSTSIIFTPHIVPTRPMRTLYWTGVLSTFPPLQAEPIVIENVINWTFPPLPSPGVK